jgi:hypothetical protein
MNDKLKITLISVAAVVALVVAFVMIKGALTVGDLDRGQVQYTPGVPPWKEADANKRGPGAGPGSAQTQATPSGAQSPAASTGTTPGSTPAGSSSPGAPPAGTNPNGPPGPPVINNTGK